MPRRYRVTKLTRSALATAGFLAMSGLCLGFVGCTALERGTDKIVSQGLRAVNQDDNQAQVEELLTSKHVRDAARELTGVVLEAAVDDLGDEERLERIREIAVDFVEELTPALSRSFEAEVWPGVRAKLEDAVGLVLDRVLSEETLERTRGFAADTAREVIEATAPELVDTISTGLATGLETALVAVLRGEVLPVIEELLDRDPGPAVAELSRQAAHGALLGVADAMDGEFGVIFDRERDEIFAKLHQSAGSVAWPIKAAGVVVVLLAALGVYVIWRQRRGQRRRDRALEVLIGEFERRGDDDVLRGLGGGEGGAYLNEVMRKRSGA